MSASTCCRRVSSPRVRYDSKFYALPLDVDWFSMVVRPDILAQHGLSAPATWEESLRGAATFFIVSWEFQENCRILLL